MSNTEKLQSMSMSPHSLHSFMKNLKSDISKEYKEQVDCSKDSESDSYNKKMKWNRKQMTWLGMTWILAKPAPKKENLSPLHEYLQLKQLLTAFKEKQPNVNNRPSKLCALRSKWIILTGSKMTHSVCVCSVQQNFILLFNAMDWDLTYRDLIKKTV